MMGGLSQLEQAAMRRALDAASSGIRGANPLVGAAIIVGDRIVAVGQHLGRGTPHAEVDALRRAQRAGADTRGATMVVTLEPCSHYGRTGPCVDALIAAGISRVVCAMADPHQIAAGGADVLRRAGIDVEVGLLEHQARALNHRWLAAITANRPFVTAKIAQSLDGRVCAADGSSQWITGPAARRSGHRIRGLADAVLVGTGTLLADDPELSARDDDGQPAGPQPLRVVMGHRPVPDDARLTRGPWRQVATHDPRVAIRELAAEGVEHLLVEGGPTVVSAFLAADLVDQLLVHIAPRLLGAGRGGVADLGVDTLADSLDFRIDDITRHGDDVVLELTPRKGEPQCSLE